MKQNIDKIVFGRNFIAVGRIFAVPEKENKEVSND